MNRPFHDTSSGALADDIRRVVTQAEQFLKSSATQSGEALDEGREKLAEKVSALRSQLEAWGDDAGKEARHLARSADRSLHQHPYAAIGVAAAVGVLIALLATRRR